MHLNFEYSYANNLGSHKTHMLKVITIRGITLPRGNSLFFFPRKDTTLVCIKKHLNVVHEIRAYG